MNIGENWHIKSTIIGENYKNWVELSVTVVRKLKQLSQVKPQGGSETINLVKCHRDSETETIESS